MLLPLYAVLNYPDPVKPHSGIMSAHGAGKHAVCCMPTCLAIGEDGAVLAPQHGAHNVLHLLEHLLLAGGWAEHAVKGVCQAAAIACGVVHAASRGLLDADLWPLC